MFRPHPAKWSSEVIAKVPLVVPASALNCTSDSNESEAILCHLDHCPHLLFSFNDLLQKISLLSVKGNMRTQVPFTHITREAAGVLILPGEEFWLGSMWFWSLQRNMKERGVGEWTRPIRQVDALMEAQRDPALDPPAVLSFTHAHTHTGRFDQQTNSFGYPERLHKKKQVLNTPETLLECWNISRFYHSWGGPVITWGSLQFSPRKVWKHIRKHYHTAAM